MGKSKYKSVVVTGVGAVSPLGNTAQASWKGLMEGHSGIAQIQSFDALAFPTRIAAEVKNFEIEAAFFKQKWLRYAIPFVKYGLAAAHEAFEDAGLFPQSSNAERWGVVVGSGMMTAPYEYLERFQKACYREGRLDWQSLIEQREEFLALADFAQTTSCTGLALLSQQFNIRGYSNAVHTACASSGQALGLALQVLRRGDADYILAGGFDSMIHPLGLSSFCLLGALSIDNDNPSFASRPFERSRNGFVLGEGAAFLILEDYEKAKARGAKIYAELAGEGNSLSAYRITDSHPSGDGAIQAIEGALADAAALAEEVDYINAHGTATKMNDLSETNAIKAVFKEKAYKIPVSATKSQTGHLIAAAGALEAVFTVLAIQKGQIPQTANLKQADPDCDLDYVSEGPREKAVGIALSNSFGFGGSNSALLFKHPQLIGQRHG